MLAQLLGCAGIDRSCSRTASREYVEQRVRAGVLEQGTVELLREAGVGERMRPRGHGPPRHRAALRRRAPPRSTLAELTGGRAITVYGQHEVVKDLIAARLDSRRPLLFEVADVARRTTSTPSGRASASATTARRTSSTCDVDRRLRRLPRRLPAERSRRRAARSTSASIRSPGSASWPSRRRRATSSSTPTTSAASRCSRMRSPELTRLYLQCRPDEDLDDWPDERIWDELQRARGAATAGRSTRGRSSRRASPPMRSFVAEPMQLRPPVPRRRRRAHRAADRRQGPEPRRRRRARARRGARRLLSRRATRRCSTRYSDACLRRVWRAEHFSWWMTSMLHRSPGRRPLRAAAAALAAALRRRARRPRRRSLAENYVGLHVRWPEWSY